MEYVALHKTVLDQHLQGSQGASAQGTWCESHIMAPAVCILNPSNGTHNCRPGGGLRWVRSPTAAHRSKHALARSSNHALACHASGPHREGASSISRGGALAQRRGFGACGWKGVGTPDRRPTCSWDPPLQAPRPTTLSEGRSCLGVGPTRKPVLKVTGSVPSLCKTERRGRGLDSVARDNPADSMMAQDRRCLPYP